MGVAYFSCVALAWPRTFYFTKTKEVKIMSVQEYHAAVLQAAQVSKLLTMMLNEEAQELFEQYGYLYESIVQYECVNRPA